MVTRQPWNSKHRNPSKVHRQRVANKKATTATTPLVSSKAKLSGKAAKKLEKKIRRAEREKEEFNLPKPTPTQQKATTTPSNTNADATPSTTTDDSEMKPAAPAATSAKKKKATKTINTDAMDVDELIADKPRVAEIRRSRKSKAAPMNVD